MTKTVIAGKPFKLTYAISINPDCTKYGDPEFRVTASPTQGRLSVKNGRDFPGFPATNVRSACNTKAVPSVQVWYQAPKSFAGQEQIGLMRITSNGTTTQTTFVVNVIP